MFQFGAAFGEMLNTNLYSMRQLIVINNATNKVNEHIKKESSLLCSCGMTMTMTGVYMHYFNRDTIQRLI